MTADQRIELRSLCDRLDMRAAWLTFREALAVWTPEIAARLLEVEGAWLRSEWKLYREAQLCGDHRRVAYMRVQVRSQIAIIRSIRRDAAKVL